MDADERDGSSKLTAAEERTKNPIGLLTSKMSFERDMTAALTRKSAYTKSRLPTFGSLTTAKPMHQGSNVAIGPRKGHLIGGVKRKSDDGRARQQMTPNEVSHHHKLHMTSH